MRGRDERGGAVAVARSPADSNLGCTQRDV